MKFSITMVVLFAATEMSGGEDPGLAGPVGDSLNLALVLS